MAIHPTNMHAYYISGTVPVILPEADRKMIIRISKAIMWYIKGEKYLWIKLEQRRAGVRVTAILNMVFTVGLHEQ